jgi:triacylglycerol lipase
VRLKALPPASIELLVSPQSDTEYVHFEDSLNHEFNREANEFSRVNAWWLADAALLAYWDEVPARSIWNRAGLDLEFLDEDGVQCHVGSTAGLVIVAFRGTGPEWHDLVHIADVRHRDWDLGGAVHAGFLKAHTGLWPKLEKTLERLDPTRDSTWFTGHSYGAALATLSMDRWPGRGLYTIGSPPVGNRRFAKGFDARHPSRCFRYVNHRDIIVYVGSWLKVLVGDYTHVEKRQYIDGSGPTAGAAVPLVHWPGFLIDHTPRRYAVHIWNDYAASGATSPAAEFSRV